MKPTALICIAVTAQSLGFGQLTSSDGLGLIQSLPTIGIVAGDEVGQPEPGTRAVKFEVEAMPAQTQLGDEIPACKVGDRLYFYDSQRQGPTGMQWTRKGRSRWGLKVSYGTAGTASKPELVSKSKFSGFEKLGIVWSDLDNGFIICQQVQTPGGQYHSRIYLSHVINESQVEEIPLSLHSPTGSDDFHPAIDPSGQILVFASIREGNFGGADLYYCRRKANQWTTPVNLGPSINTPNDEGFPAFDAGGKLYFSSRGLPGFGEWDIYWTQWQDSAWQAPLNAGAQINSVANDLGMAWNHPDYGNTGVFASDRFEENGFDIFAFIRHTDLWIGVRDAATLKTIPTAKVRMREPGLNWIPVEIDKLGQAIMRLRDEEDWEIEVRAEGYATEVRGFSQSKIIQGEDLAIDFKLHQLREARVVIQIQDSNVHSSTPGKLVIAPDSLVWELRDFGSGAMLDTGLTSRTTLVLSLDVGHDYLLTLKDAFSCSASEPILLNSTPGGKTISSHLRLNSQPRGILSGFVRDSIGQPFSSPATVQLLNAAGTILNSASTGKLGEFEIAASKIDTATSIVATHPSGHVSTAFPSGVGGQLWLNVPALPKSTEPAYVLYYPAIGGINVEGPQANVVLEIRQFLIHHPEWHAELRSFTDSRGDAQLNEELAKQRTQHLIDAIIGASGISLDRLHHQNLGERAIQNGCIDGVPCTEEQHLENRRTEVYLYPSSKNITGHQLNLIGSNSQPKASE